MNEIPSTILNHFRSLVGKRIRLIRCDDPYTKMAPGSEGTITFVDDFGTVFADWDCGSGLGLVWRVDEWELV